MENSTISWQLVGILWGVLLGLIAVIWNLMLRRIENVETGKASQGSVTEVKLALDKFVAELNTKAKHEDMVMRRADIKELFERIESLRGSLSELNAKLAKLEGQLGK